MRWRFYQRQPLSGRADLVPKAVCRDSRETRSPPNVREVVADPFRFPAHLDLLPRTESDAQVKPRGASGIDQDLAARPVCRRDFGAGISISIPPWTRRTVTPRSISAGRHPVAHIRAMNGLCVTVADAITCSCHDSAGSVRPLTGTVALHGRAAPSSTLCRRGSPPVAWPVPP